MKSEGMKKMPCVVFDIDGVLSNHSGRLKHGLAKDWDRYHYLCQYDPPIIELVLLAKQLISQGFDIVLCTGRPEKFRIMTDQWMTNHGIDYKILYMRGDNDLSPSHIFKMKLLDRLRAEGYTVWFAVEDQTRVVEMWRENGVICLQMPDLINGRIL